MFRYPNFGTITKLLLILIPYYGYHIRLQVLSNFVFFSSEFTAKIFKDFMKEMRILHTFSYSIRKAAMVTQLSLENIKVNTFFFFQVERFNQTFENLIAREKSRLNTGRWIDHVEPCLKKYNTVNVHSFVKMTPKQADLNQSQPILDRLYKIKYSKIKRKPAKFRAGDYVRLFVDKGKFGRAYHQDFTNEIFIVAQVFTNLPKARYQLKDLNGNLILGNAIDEELTKFIP